MNYLFGFIRIGATEGFQLRYDVEGVSGLDDVVLEVAFVAAISQLRQAVFLGTELRVQVVQLQRRWFQRPEQRRKHSHLIVHHAVVEKDAIRAHINVHIGKISQHLKYGPAELRCDVFFHTQTMIHTCSGGSGVSN